MRPKKTLPETKPEIPRVKATAAKIAQESIQPAESRGNKVNTQEGQYRHLSLDLSGE